MRYAILTGHSKGMGEAMAQQFLAEGTYVLGISRTANAKLARHWGEAQQEASAAAAASSLLEQWQCDLADGLTVAEKLTAWLATLDSTNVDSIVLVNNAALLTKIAPLHEVPPPQLVLAVRVGLEAPILLTHAFLAATQRACS